MTTTHNQTPHKQLNPSVTVWVVSVTCVFLISTKPGPGPLCLASPCRDTARQLLFCYHLSTESIPSISRPSCTPTRPQNGNDKIKPQCLYLFVGFVVTQGWYHRVTQLCTVCLRDFNDVSRKFPQYLENSLNLAFPSIK